MVKFVRMPRFYERGVDPLRRPFQKKQIEPIVFSTETEGGVPYLLIFYDGKKLSYIRVRRGGALDEFMNYLAQRCTGRQKKFILFARNLASHLSAVLCSYERELFRYKRPPILKHPLGSVQVFVGKIWSARIVLTKNVAIRVVDLNAFVGGPLYQLSKSIGLRHRGEMRPGFVQTEKRPDTRRGWQDLYRRCRAEILATDDLGWYVLDLHKKYDTALTVSAPHFASSVFRRYFLKTPLPQAPPAVRWLAERSMYGGRSGVFTERMVIPDVYYYDYNSFYSWAMANLPPLTDGTWRAADKFEDEYEGFYLVDGFAKGCKYPILLKPGRKPHTFASGERVKRAPVTSYEVREALRRGELVPSDIHGYVWIPTESAENPFRNYVDVFFSLKEKSKEDTPQYGLYKLFLNALYGKTYQSQREHGYEEAPDAIWSEKLQRCVGTRIPLRAGRMYLPHVASWVTSMCRARLHGEIHSYDALDCVVDSIKTTRGDVPTGGGLGEASLKCSGLLLLLRPKLYVMFSKDINNEVVDDFSGDLRAWLGKNLDAIQRRLVLRPDEKKIYFPKYALHSFFGPVTKLLRLYRDRSSTYLMKYVVGAPAAVRRRKRARVVMTAGRKLRIDWESELMPCGLTMEEALKQQELCVAPNCYNCPYTQHA